MKPWAMVEIAAAVDEPERTELIRAAYQSSRSGLVALALRGVSWQSVDRALDGVVDAQRDRTQGVVYLEATEIDEDIISTACQARVIISSSDDFRTQLLQHGIRTVGLADAARFLDQAPSDSRSQKIA